MQKVCWLLVAIVCITFVTSGRALAVDVLNPPPESSVADFADNPADAPQPQFADGTPGQYVLHGSKWSQPGGLGMPVTLTYSFKNLLDGGIRQPDGSPLPASIIRSSIQEALRLWASAAPLNFVEVPDDGLPYGSSTHYGQLRFQHLYYNGPDPVVGQPTTKAYAYYPSDDVLAGDVVFDDSDRWQEIGTLPQPDILGVAIHEIGHALGLEHSTGIRPGDYWTWQIYDANNNVVPYQTEKGNANMFWICTRYTGLGTGQLYGDDILGIQAIYGAGTGSVSPIPEPAALLLIVVGLVMFGMVGRRNPHRRARANASVPIRPIR
jgi:hypothetical protein